MDACSLTPLADETLADDARWEVAGRFVDALLRRDFHGLEACLAANARCQVLESTGPWSRVGATETVDAFRTWFGAADVFEVHDAAIGQLGNRVYLRWRIVLRSSGLTTSAQVIEQHVFASTDDHITAMDVLTSNAVINLSHWIDDSLSGSKGS